LRWRCVKSSNLQLLSQVIVIERSSGCNMKPVNLSKGHLLRSWVTGVIRPSWRSPRWLQGILLGLLVVTASCANNSASQSLEDSLAPDPQLQAQSQRPRDQGLTASPTEIVLPEDFPADLPRYPNLELIRVEAIAGTSFGQTFSKLSPQGALPSAPTPKSSVETILPGKITVWRSADPVDAVIQFYRSQFQDGDWQLKRDRAEGATHQFEVENSAFQISLQLSSVAASANGLDQGQTEVTIVYTPRATASQPSPTATAGSNDFAPSDSSQLPIGSSLGTPNRTPQNFTDLDQVPKELREQVSAVAQLGVLSLKAGNAVDSIGAATLLKPNQVVTRREFARWLFAANNRIYADRPARQIRAGLPNADPVFQDVPQSDPDFAAIQGLAEAGIIPSRLTNDTISQFRPNDPLTREQLLLWKVPLDLRQSLPTPNLETVKQTWGFQDAARITPRTIPAVMADYQNGDLSNIRRVFGYTQLLQPQKKVTRAEAAAALWYFGTQTDGISVQTVLESRGGDAG